MTKEELKHQIIEAFKGVTLGNGIGLRQANGLDDYASEEKILEYRRQDEKEDWQKISSEDLNNYHSALSYFDAEGMRFHLPAFMLDALEDGEGPDFTLTHDVESDHFKERFSVLNKAQKEAVKNYLLYTLDQTPGYDHTGERKVILRALEKYWN